MTTAIIEELERRILPSKDILRYILAGRATFTLRSVVSSTRYTYKVSKCKNSKEFSPFYFVSLMTGPDNEGDFTYLGTLSGSHFSLTHKSRLPITATPVAAFKFFWLWLHNKPELTENIEFWHSGRCGRCGKKLTVPESIALGLGPECAGK
jgi:hypothetical protein